MGVVPAFDELEDVEPGVGVRPVGSAIDPLAFEGGEEAHTHRVVVEVTDGPLPGDIGSRTRWTYTVNPDRSDG